MTAIAVALMPLVLLAVEDWRDGRRPRTLALAAAGALLVTLAAAVAGRHAACS